jgi:hypothetical protein
MLQDPHTYFKITEYGKDNSKVIFLFGGWKFNGIVYRPLLHDLVRRGYKCILYVPNIKLIAVGTPYSEIVDTARAAAKDVTERIEQEKISGITSFTTIGVSFGTIFAMESAKVNHEIDKVLLFAPFGDFAEHVKLWPDHKYFSKVLASQPTTQRESGEVLNQVGLHNNLSLLEGRRLLVCYSDNDTSIHTQAVENFLRMLKEHNLDVNNVKVKGGHILGILKNLFINKEYSAFLSNT